MFNVITAVYRSTFVTFPFNGIASSPIKHLCRYSAAQTEQYAVNLAFTAFEAFFVRLSKFLLSLLVLFLVHLDPHSSACVLSKFGFSVRVFVFVHLDIVAS